VLTLAAIQWFKNAYMVEQPLLQNLAMKLFEQPSSFSCCERYWSTYSLTIHQGGTKWLQIMGRTRFSSIIISVFFHERVNSMFKGRVGMRDICGDGVDSLGDVRNSTTIS